MDRCRCSPNRHQFKKSPSPSVGAREVRSGGEGPDGRPRPVPCAHLLGNAITPPAPGDPQGPPFPASSTLAPTDHHVSRLSSGSKRPIIKSRIIPAEETTMPGKNSTEDGTTSPDENSITGQTHVNSIGQPPATAAQFETNPLDEAIPPGKAPAQRPGCFLLAAITFVLGIAAGIGATLLFLLLISGNKAPLPVATPAASPTPGNVTVQANATLVASALQSALQDAQLPGNVSNIRVQFASGDQLTVTGDYMYKVLGLNVTNPFTLTMQPIVRQCQLQTHILQAHFANVPVTGLVAVFEDKINQQLISATIALPGHIEYCMVAVHTDPATGLSVTMNLVFPTPNATPTPTSTTLHLSEWRV